MTTDKLRQIVFTMAGLTVIATAQQNSKPPQQIITPLSSREVKIDGIGRFKLTGVRRVGSQIDTWNPDGSPAKLDDTERSNSSTEPEPSLEFICEAQVSNPDYFKDIVRVRVPDTESPGRIKSVRVSKSSGDENRFTLTFSTSIKPGPGNTSFVFALPTKRFETIASCDLVKGTTWTADPKNFFEVGRDRATKVSGEVAEGFPMWFLRYSTSRIPSDSELWILKKDGTETRLSGSEGRAIDDGWNYLAKVENCSWEEAARFEIRKPVALLVRFDDIALSPREAGK